MKARLMPAVGEPDLPLSLLLAFGGETLLQRIVRLLEFLSPFGQAF